MIPTVGTRPVSEAVFDALWAAAVARGAIDPDGCLDDPGVGEALAAPGHEVTGDWDRDIDRVRIGRIDYTRRVYSNGTCQNTADGHASVLLTSQPVAPDGSPWPLTRTPAPMYRTTCAGCGQTFTRYDRPAC